MLLMRRSCLLALLLGSSTPLVWAAELCVIGFNIQSEEVSVDTIKDTVANHSDCDIWGFSEAGSSTFGNMEKIERDAAEHARHSQYHTILGTTGGQDRLVVMYDSQRLLLLGLDELKHLEEERGRAPLVARFELRDTGTAFLFTVNHFYRGNSDDNLGKRAHQAEGLNRWAREQTLPIIAVGDYNFDWRIPDGASRDAGFDLLTAANVFTWVKPASLVRTQCSRNSVLDFVFVAQGAQSWSATSTILEPQSSYCPDNDDRSDHRPVQGVFQVPQP